MKKVIFTSLIIFLSLLCGCGRSAEAPPKLVVKKAPPICRPAESQEIAMVDAPVKRNTSEKIAVVIDAGHGGEDFGTHSLGNPKYQEKYLNMSTALLVKGFLQQFGYHVIMTRTDDTFISLDDRALFANKQNPRLFVSIHYNSAPSREAEGVEVFYYRDDEDKSRIAKSKLLAQSILNKTLQNTQAKSRGVKHGNYSVIRQTNMPAALIECGFLTNAAEMERIKNGAYLKSIALGIAQGIQEYLSKDGVLADRQ